MKAKNRVRKLIFWDPNFNKGQGIEITQLMTDWELVTKAPAHTSLVDYSNAAIRILLEACDIDPDLFKPLGMNASQTDALHLAELIKKAVTNVQGTEII